MNLEELWVIHKTATTTNRMIMAIGVFMILLGLIIGNIVAYILCGIIVYILAHLAVGADITTAAIEERIVKLDPDK